MDGVDLTPLLDQLDDNIDDVQETLEPLTKAPLSETAAKLPLLDRAKLYVSITYAIESILFCEQSITVLSRDDNNMFLSIHSPQWHQRQSAPCLSRVDQTKTVLREDQGCRKRQDQEGESESRQGCSWENHPTCTCMLTFLYVR